MENIEYVRPQDIEKRSFAIISQELEEKGIVLPKEQELVTKRAIHTSADFDYAKTMTYSDHAVEIAKRLIQNGADIVTDTNMALAGVNKKELAKYKLIDFGIASFFTGSGKNYQIYGTMDFAANATAAFWI